MMENNEMNNMVETMPNVEVPTVTHGGNQLIGAVKVVGGIALAVGGYFIGKMDKKAKDEDALLKKKAAKMKKKGIIMCKQVEEDGVIKMVPIVGDDSE